MLPVRRAFQSLSNKLGQGQNIMLRRWGWFVLLTLMALNCLGTSLSFVGNGYYSVVGSTVILQADKLQNNEFSGISGTIRLELWAFSSPYPGTTLGYKLY